MITYPIPMVPGPVVVPQRVLRVYQEQFGSSDIEPEFLDLYNQTEANLRQLLGTQNRVVIQTGEGMLALWAAMKSCLQPDDRVLCIANGVFGFGIADMVRSLGASVRTVSIPYNQTITDWQMIETALANFQPKMITAVHCETPSGTLNPLEELGNLKTRYGVPLLYVDAVSSIGGAPVLADGWKIDLCLGGSQKCLSAPASMSFLSVSLQAWEIIREVNYVGYDALKPFEDAQEKFYFPYTPDWYGVAAINAGAEIILEEGLEKSFKRHADLAARCRKRLTELGYSLYPARSAVPAPTITAVNVPTGISWEEFDGKLRLHGLVVGGSYGPLTGKVFRIGHMGSQADSTLVDNALSVLSKVSKELKLT